MWNHLVDDRLASIDLPHLKKNFKSNGVNGPVLLELNERIIMRDLLITNEANVKRLFAVTLFTPKNRLILYLQAPPGN